MKKHWGFACVGMKKMSNAEMKKVQTASPQPSQRVPITAALKQRPGRRGFWLVPRSVWRTEVGAHGQAGNGRRDNDFTSDRSIKMRQRMGQSGHKQVRKWEHWGMKGCSEEMKAARHSEPLLEAINQLNWAELTRRGPVLQVQFLP